MDFFVSPTAPLMMTSSSQPAEAIRKGGRDYSLSDLHLFVFFFYYPIRAASQDWPELV